LFLFLIYFVCVVLCKYVGAISLKKQEGGGNGLFILGVKKLHFFVRGSQEKVSEGGKIFGKMSEGGKIVKINCPKGVKLVKKISEGV